MATIKTLFYITLQQQKQWVIFSQHSQGSTIVTHLTVFTQGAGVMD